VRPPKFHVLVPFSIAWPDVCPGDVVVAPETIFRTYDEKHQSIITANRPLFVLARIDGKDEFGEEIASYASTFIVYSVSRGFIVTVMNRFTDGELGT